MPVYSDSTIQIYLCHSSNRIKKMASVYIIEIGLSDHSNSITVTIPIVSYIFGLVKIPYWDRHIHTGCGGVKHFSGITTLLLTRDSGLTVQHKNELLKSVAKG